MMTHIFVLGASVTFLHLSLGSHLGHAEDLPQGPSRTALQQPAPRGLSRDFASPKATSAAIANGLVIQDGVTEVAFTGPRFGDAELLRLASHKSLQLIIIDSTAVTGSGIRAVKELNPAIKVRVSYAWATDLLRRCCGNRTHGGIGWEYNPADLIDAVNYLRTIPQCLAIEVLRRFTSESTAEEQKCLTVVIPMAFKDGAEDVQVLRSSGAAREALSAQYDFMVLDIHMEEGIPFDVELMHPSVLGGSYPGTLELPLKRSYLVDWAATRVTPATEPLRPSGKPTGAALRLFRRLAATGRYNSGELAELKRYLLSQAKAMEARNVQIGD